MVSPYRLHLNNENKMGFYFALSSICTTFALLELIIFKDLYA